MYSFLSALFLLIIGAFCSYNAKLRGRNPYAWFAIGLFLGAIGLLILYLLPPKKPTFESTPSVATPANAVAAAPDIAVEQESTLVPPSKPAPPQKLWYYLDEENKRFGPMSFDRLKQAWALDQVKRETFVWNEDMEDWKPVKDLSNLLDQLGEMTPPPSS